MAGTTTAMATSFKSELMAGGHCFNATVTPTGSSTSSTSYTSVSSLAGVAVGMPFTGTNVGAGSVVAAITSASAFTSSVASTGTISGGTLTVTGDIYKMALIKISATGTYDATSTNYTNITGNTDEVSGTGYTATGTALTNVSPVTSSTTAYITFSPNPSWSSATFSTSACMIYNTSVRNGGTSGTNTTGGGRCVAVYDFGGNQSVSAGTLTILCPTAAAGTAIVRIA